MEEAEENREKGCFSRDMLDKFINGKRNHENVEGEGDIELSLGLSLNGRFGVDPKRAKKLNRSSSITNFVLSGDDSNGNGFQFPLIRTCSLPVETEEEWRKRKELQSLRRLEAKKKRLEKMKNVRVVTIKENEENGNCCYSNNGEVCGNSLPSSGGSQGSGSSGMTDLESQQQPVQGSSDSTEARPPVSGQSPLHEHEQEQKPVVAIAPEMTNKKPPVSSGTVGKKAKETLRNFMLNMPCVSTRGEGPNGKKIEGFLYGYRKGEEVKILCVCHGTFLSPAEFVKHAGGGDVEHPLRHIVINPSPLL
ncbi:ninja-family protein AFP3 [Lycium ferocissimum]|uniref:ninja-family protein AFP3 n=1 Tax=Lycium ferocissimum TaxID=112874 RepID=UPI002814E272|nr:ninja-family protein AFP3 [Lycium ferocissimum]